MKAIAFIDFDGTIYKGDSMLDFVAEVRGRRFLRRSLFLLIPRIVGMKTGFYSKQKTKEALLSRAFKRHTPEQLLPYQQSFTKQIDDRLFNKARQKMVSLKNAGVEICIVSASLDIWLEPWCSKQGFSLICSRAEIINNQYSGMLLGKNCRGQEKVNRIRELYDLSSYNDIYCYGNDLGDKEMLMLANQPTEALYQ